MDQQKEDFGKEWVWNFLMQTFAQEMAEYDPYKEHEFFEAGGDYWD